MFDRSLLPIVRPQPSDAPGLLYAEGIEENGVIVSGKTRSATTGEAYPVGSGYLDLLKGRLGADNAANLTNFLPGAGRGYEPLWRVRSLTLLTGETFPNKRELEVITGLVQQSTTGPCLDLGCSAGLYARNLTGVFEAGVVGVDISPSMLHEAARRSGAVSPKPSFARADAEELPFADESFSAAVCGGTLNEIGAPARALRETNRVLKPGGRLAIMGILKARTPNGRRLQRFLSTGGIQFFSPDGVQGLLTVAGFEPDPLQTFGSVFFVAATK